jgi:hypothetical protein
VIRAAGVGMGTLSTPNGHDSEGHLERALRIRMGMDGMSSLHLEISTLVCLPWLLHHVNHVSSIAVYYA